MQQKSWGKEERLNIICIGFYSEDVSWPIRPHPSPCPRSSRLQPSLGYRPHHRHPSRPPSFAWTGSSRPICVAMPGSLGRVGWGCLGQARWAPCLHRYRRSQRCWLGQLRGLDRKQSVSWYSSDRILLLWCEIGEMMGIREPAYPLVPRSG